MDRIELMKTYASVVTRQSYSEAARDLGVTRALVSKRVQSLEGVLGVRLINRNTHTMSVTAIGRKYYDQCRELLSHLARIEGEIGQHRTLIKGDLRILSSKTFGENILAAIVSDFSALYPDVKIQLMIRNMLPDSGDLIAGGFDLAFRTTPITDSSLICRSVIGLPRVLVAAPAYLQKHGAILALEDLSHHNCLDPCGSQFFEWEFRQGGKRRRIRVSGNPRVNSSTAVCHAALKGLGVAMLREYLVSNHIRSGALVKVLAGSKIDERKLYMLYEKHKFPAARANIFTKYVSQNIRRYI